MSRSVAHKMLVVLLALVGGIAAITVDLFSLANGKNIKFDDNSLGIFGTAEIPIRGVVALGGEVSKIAFSFKVEGYGPREMQLLASSSNVGDAVGVKFELNRGKSILFRRLNNKVDDTGCGAGMRHGQVDIELHFQQDSIRLMMSTLGEGAAMQECAKLQGNGVSDGVEYFLSMSTLGDEDQVVEILSLDVESDTSITKASVVVDEPTKTSVVVDEPKKASVVVDEPIKEAVKTDLKETPKKTADSILEKINKLADTKRDDTAVFPAFQDALKEVEKNIRVTLDEKLNGINGLLTTLKERQKDLENQLFEIQSNTAPEITQNKKTPGNPEAKMIVNQVTAEIESIISSRLEAAVSSIQIPESRSEGGDGTKLFILFFILQCVFAVLLYVALSISVKPKRN